MPRTVYTASAMADLDEIWAYIGIESHAADGLIDMIEQRVNMLLTQPMLGEAFDLDGTLKS